MPSNTPGCCGVERGWVLGPDFEMEQEDCCESRLHQREEWGVLIEAKTVEDVVKALRKYKVSEQ